MKELVLTEWSFKCRRCGKVFKAGDRVVKTRIKAQKGENPFYCPDHFYSEK